MYASIGRVERVSEIKDTAEYTAFTCKAVSEFTTVADKELSSKASPEPQIV
jgi:hypothetical protein